jgi:hypothetical protein
MIPANNTLGISTGHTNWKYNYDRLAAVNQHKVIIAVNPLSNSHPQLYIPLRFDCHDALGN